MFLQSLEVTLSLLLEDRMSKGLQRKRRDSMLTSSTSVLLALPILCNPQSVGEHLLYQAQSQSGALSSGPRERKTWGHQWQAPKPLALPSLIQVATCPRWVGCHVLRAGWKGRMWLLLSACCLPSLSRLEASMEDKIS